VTVPVRTLAAAKTVTGDGEPIVRIRGVSKAFGAFKAVDGVDLDIRRGELFALLGGSGCGKSTLLRMLAGFETPTAGRIEIDGVDMDGVAPYDRPVNMMFQSYALFPHMSVESNVGFGLRQERRSRAEIAERVAKALALVQLSTFAGRKPHQLSGGQRQRVALARALVKRPKVLLLDEPLGALDRKLRQETQFELKAIQHEIGVTFVIVTHDQEEAMSMADRIGVMNAGQLVQMGPPPELYEAPANRFVAQFIGSINLFEGTVTAADGDGGTVAVPGMARPAIVRGALPVLVGGKVVIAVRPERLALGPTAEKLANRAEGAVDEVAYLGDHSIYRLRLASGQTVQATVSNVGRGLDRAWPLGATVQIGWAADAAIVLAG
jgi:putrescine transport system ATP-binding protein